MIAIVPVSTTAEILQNVATILATPKLSVPLDRAFGVDGGGLDSPLDIAQARLTADYSQAIAKYEPRASLKSLTLTVSQETGQLSAAVTILIGGQQVTLNA